ncbi:DNA gyrase subunit A [Dehalogenimonas formicexedens]|uniref:DNA gyrase subunit A n=1 Tax=Dehalogenimonas formicexedens TaxID=1839801 RepID=A0A1P8F4K2_9CHLR|nr:DNA gyrase subunit A [Dehalogenimonas formicexedens]APV43385.1 DNA gyrase subunit A [Dehalogenimonas formicexedens]
MVIGKTRPINIEEEMKNSYLDYAMSVIVSRALPDVRDGLKPVHRRILYAMSDMGMHYNTAYKKSARIVGEVLGKYHPHGDSSVYDAMVRMAQPFSMRYTLVDGQGNFGSVDADPPAAMRYTEARLTRLAEEMLVDIDKDTVDFMPNFDASLNEPTVLPSRLPNLLMNGSAGIAVGMATNIPPHNLSELCDGIVYLIDNPECTMDDLMHFVKGPDFPTGGIILGADGIRSAYASGHGKVVIRARAHITDASETGKRQIIITELPYQVNKAELVSRIAGLVREKKVTGIAEVRDESDRQGLRVVIDLKRDGQPQQILNNLHKHTNLQDSFFINMLALVDGKPQIINLKEALKLYVEFRQVVITRRSKFELKAAKDRAHILEGLKIALDNLDAIINLIRKAENSEVARRELQSRFGLSQIQAQAILDLQLRRLAGLERQKILDEYAEVLKQISYLEDLLANPRKILTLIKTDVAEIKAKYGDARRTEIQAQGVIEFREEDLIPHQSMVVTLTERNFIKRVPTEVYRLQNRAGRGKSIITTREEDAVRFIMVADTHDSVLLFTNRGRIFSIKCHEIPCDLSRTAKGLAIINLVPLSENEKITAMLSLTDFKEEYSLIMGTAGGEIKRTPASDFASVRSSGLLAMDLPKGDELIGALVAKEDDNLILITRDGQSIRFPVSDLRVSQRASGGVRGIALRDDDRMVGMDVTHPGHFVLVITSGGMGKLTPVEEYPLQHRGGSGVLTFKVVEKTGPVVAGKVVDKEHQVMIATAEGVVIRTPVGTEDSEKGIVVMGRSTQGVIVIRPDENDRVVTFGTMVV